MGSFVFALDYVIMQRESKVCRLYRGYSRQTPCCQVMVQFLTGDQQ